MSDKSVPMLIGSTAAILIMVSIAIALAISVLYLVEAFLCH